MSSDDSLCILRSPRRDGHGDEWRVKHLGSLHWTFHDHQADHGSVDEIRSLVREHFKDAPVFQEEAKCDAYCEELIEHLQQSGLPEYGDTNLILTQPLWGKRRE